MSSLFDSMVGASVGAMESYALGRTIGNAQDRANNAEQLAAQS